MTISSLVNKVGALFVVSILVLVGVLTWTMTTYIWWSEVYSAFVAIGHSISG